MQPSWQHEQRLDGQGVVLLRWNSSRPDGQDDVLELELAARTRGYVGLGLSPYTGTMAGADLVLAWVDDAGVAHARVSIIQEGLYKQSSHKLQNRPSFSE